MKKKFTIVIFTDLDGSLLHRDTFQFNTIKDYIKNLVKECFKKGFIKHSERGISGGVLTNKTIRHLRQ